MNPTNPPNPTAASNPSGSMLRRAFSQPAFLVVALVLFAAAAGLNASTNYLKWHFRKLPVPLARSLNEVPQQLGPWKQVSIDEPLTHEFQDALATEFYVFRDYVDTRMVTAEELDLFKDRSPMECRKIAQYLQLQKPGAVVSLALTYYTGLADTVAHIPDRCYVADGYEPTKWEVLSWDSLKDRPGDGKLRQILFEDLMARDAGLHVNSSVKVNVAYFFNCNGRYVNDPLDVRKSMADLRHRYGYYMKVELKMLKVDPEQASRVMNDFLSNALPESEKCLPDWSYYSKAD